jgi:hypothetical protein
MGPGRVLVADQESFRSSLTAGPQLAQRLWASPGLSRDE